VNERILTRMGDGEQVALPAEEIRADLAEGSLDAAERAQIPALDDDEQEHLFQIFADPSRTVSVERGQEVVVTDDGGTMCFYSGQDGGGVGIPMARQQAVLAYERACAADTTSIGHSDYSYKPVKPVINTELQEYYSASMVTTAPLFYGAQPNMGLYFQPDGPHPNPSDLLPLGKIDEARASQEAAAEDLAKDLIFVGQRFNEMGCEGINFDTSGSAGDADFLAALRAVAELKKIAPKMAIELGASGEFVLGMHGEVEFAGQRLAGMYPHQQVKMAEAAGADIFGVAVGVSTSRSIPWNLARAVTFVKAAVAAADIPVHVNVGMGVGGVPMLDMPPVDAVTRCSKALVQIGKADGL
jgi:dimethylamine---corrinoid protein Co-methyltransferase